MVKVRGSKHWKNIHVLVISKLYYDLKYMSSSYAEHVINVLCVQEPEEPKNNKWLPPSSV